MKKRGGMKPPSTRVECAGASILWGASSPSIHGGEISNSQRDHIKSTIIINLGGFDSDVSRATSATNKSDTSESAGGSPKASASSTSDQEQSSILEESSVSTDSGLGTSDASIEVGETESPPSEGITIKEEPSNSIYKRHMYLKGHGFPLWIPQPNVRLSCSYRRRGVSIGDVGIFTPGGGFDFLFNICLPAGHPDNPDELPEGFCCLPFKPADVCEFRAHSSHSDIASSSITKQGEMFHCSESDGALLVMPQGAHAEDLRNISRFRDHASLHVESWYQYANGPCGREIGNAELHLVTGCDKTTSWGIAAYAHGQSKREDDTTLLKFSVSSEAPHTLYPTLVWEKQGAANVKAGPENDELIDLLEVDAVRPLRNQCTFVRTLTPGLRVGNWERLQAKVTASADDRTSARSLESPPASVFGLVSSLPGSFSGYSREGTSKLIDSVTSEKILSAHPATYVVDMLLQKCPKAKVVIVHDSDWCSVIRDSDDDWTYIAQDLPHRIQEAFNIVEDKTGTVYLEEKTRLSTSSDVSVKLEAEDRKPGPSQLSDPIEISPSDMQVDCLRSEKMVDNGDGDIRVPNNFHPSSSQGARLIISSDGPTNQPSYTLNTDNTQPNQEFFWSSAPRFNADLNLGPADHLQYNNEVWPQSYAPPSKSLRGLSAYPRMQSDPQSPPPQISTYSSGSSTYSGTTLVYSGQSPTFSRASPTYSGHSADDQSQTHRFFEVSSLEKIQNSEKRLYNHREQIDFFRAVVDLPTRGYGPFVPQPMYKPHMSSDRKRYVEEIELEAPIYFSMDQPSEFGILLSDALHSRVKRLENRDQLVFEGCGPSVSIRLEWPGYRQWCRQIPTKDFRTPPGPITLSKLAKNVAKCVQRFIEERKHQSLEDDCDPCWKVGTGATHIKLEDLVLVSIHHVSLGSWQPQLRLNRQLPRAYGVGPPATGTQPLINTSQAPSQMYHATSQIPRIPEDPHAETIDPCLISLALENSCQSSMTTGGDNLGVLP